jgi:hypothetical protein
MGMLLFYLPEKTQMHQNTTRVIAGIQKLVASNIQNS